MAETEAPDGTPIIDGVISGTPLDGKPDPMAEIAMDKLLAELMVVVEPTASQSPE